jgi:hypothetical protein
MREIIGPTAADLSTHQCATAPLSQIEQAFREIWLLVVYGLETGLTCLPIGNPSQKQRKQEKGRISGLCSSRQ